MKKFLLIFLAGAMSLLSQPLFAQEEEGKELGLPGDNLDLYAVLALFQKSKTIEDFEKQLNAEKTGINNLDLNLDKKVDFIKVVTKKDGDSFTFILRVDVTKTESQDVAVILVDKNKDKKVSLQIVGDEELYGKNYVIEPSKTDTPAQTANPAYKGADPVTVSAPATTTVVVETQPIVQYVYSPAYVPYYPPYYYGYYPPYFFAFSVMAVGIYRHNNYYHHHGYYGGHYGGGNTVIINNRNNFNNYNNNKMRSNTVNNNVRNNKYNSGTNRGNNRTSSNRPSAGTSNRPSTGTSNRGPSASTRPSTGTSDRSSTRPSTGTSNRASTGVSSPSSRPSSSSTMGSGRTRSGGGASGGGFSRGGGGGRRR
ncbi:hypothetical protein NF867_16320 [Solitalea sp. MAHUQ-68]|uniref:DUF3300 domain-containing protein n=1 Tax=Solitalea agri TaxID=2953739 RepID=A0A9X2JDR7_9SPHI|nr:hypothetical protein [Solitalea agri]MCO4294428.1 hypothetical protein [Solitalea agri]